MIPATTRIILKRLQRANVAESSVVVSFTQVIWFRTCDAPNEVTNELLKGVKVRWNNNEEEVLGS
jgi:hypothetical protein